MSTDDPTHTSTAGASEANGAPLDDEAVLAQFWLQRRVVHSKREPCPPLSAVYAWFDGLLAVLFPPLADEGLATVETFDAMVQRLKADQPGLLAARPIHGRLDEAKSSYFFEGLPRIQTDLEFDAVAMYEGDPSARNVLEVVRTFPGYVATCAYR